MDIHRCRFVPYPPATINALAFSHPSAVSRKSRTPTTLRLAIGRNNGDIEIWNPLKGAWLQESVLRGGKDRSIEGLAWTQDPEEVDSNGFKSAGSLRLFSIGYSAVVTEWDLATGRPSRHSTGNYGDIWCMAAQPRLTDHVATEKGQQRDSKSASEGQYQDIAVGCADGSIVLLSTTDGDLQFKRTIARPPKKKARVLSITFKDTNTVIAGHADSTIRVYDIRSNQLLRSMSLGAGPSGGPKEILVWTVKCMSDGTIVSGDSTGTVRFWDGKLYTLIQRIAGHRADILDLAVSGDGYSIFSAGMDRKTTLYCRSESGKNGGSSRWKETAHQRIHKHDVKAMASYEDKNISVIASGGLDTIPIITPCQEFGREHHRSLSNLPQQPCVCSSPGRRLLMSWWDRELNVWRLPKANDHRDVEKSSEAIDESRKTRLVSKIELQGEDSLSCADLSVDGSLLVAATMASIRLFHLRFKKGGLPKVHKLQIPLDLGSNGARLVRFSPDRRWLLVVSASNSIYLYRIIGNNGKEAPSLLAKNVSLERLHRQPRRLDFRHGSLGHYDRTVCRVAFSHDSRILATGDLSGYVDTWVLEGQEDLAQESGKTLNGDVKPSSTNGEDSDAEQEHHPTVMFGQHWIRNPAAQLIPKMSAATLVLSFRPATIVSQTLTNKIIGIHPTRHNPHPHSNELPSGEDRLLVVTSDHHLHEFEVLKGRFSDWSRRNPTASLPPKFRDIRERAMGGVWHISKTKQRLWLYGSTWLWMFDLAKDISHQPGKSQSTGEPTLDGANQAPKRKRSEELPTADDIGQERRRRDTGAGSRIQGSQFGSGIARRMRKVKGPEIEEAEVIDLDPEQRRSPDEDDDETDNDAADRDALIDFRRLNGENPPGRVVEAVAENVHHTNGITDLTKAGEQPGPSYWCTYMYRPILGTVPLSHGVSEAAEETTQTELDEEERLEVALVERPLEEVELPPRYHGDQEWDDET